MGRLCLRLAVVLVVAACGGPKKDPAKPTDKNAGKTATPAQESAEDREKKRHDAALKIVPEGSNCLPAALKEEGAPRLEIAAMDKDILLCAVDTDKSRLLGTVGCWKLDLGSGALAYQPPAPLPGHDIDAMLDDRCAHGYCLPKEAQLPATKIAHMSWNLDGTKVAVLVGDDVHVFDAKTKAHQSAFSVRGDKGLTNEPVAVRYVGAAVFVEGADQGSYSAIWQFKEDGTKVGPLVAIGAKDNKPISTYRGGFLVLDPKTVGINEHGFEYVHTFEYDTGKRAKLVRKVPKTNCKADEIDAFWHDGDKVTDKCKESMEKIYGPFIGADAVLGTKSFVVTLRGERLGEVGVFDKKTLAENDKKLFKLAWCEKSTAAAN